MEPEMTSAPRLSPAQWAALRFLRDGPCTRSACEDDWTTHHFGGPHGSVVMTAKEAQELRDYYETNPGFSAKDRSIFRLTAKGRRALELADPSPAREPRT